MARDADAFFEQFDQCFDEHGGVGGVLFQFLDAAGEVEIRALFGGLHGFAGDMAAVIITGSRCGTRGDR